MSKKTWRRPRHSAPYKAAGASGNRLPLRKRLLFGGVTTIGFFCLLELLLAACGVRAASYEDDPFVGFSSYSPLYVSRRDAAGKVQFVTANNKRDGFNHQQFAKDKPPGTYRIFCLGGSTTYGRPYDDETSFCGWLREFLPAADNSRHWEVVNAGGISYASYRVARVMQELVRYEPDLFIVYTGHNEFLEERTYREMRHTPRLIQHLTAWLRHSGTYTLATSWLKPPQRDTGSNQRAPRRDVLPGEVKTLLDNSIGPRVYRRDDVLRRHIVAHLESNLRRKIQIAEDAGARIIFVTPASNLKDCSPFKSEHRQGLTFNELVRWERLSEAAGQAAVAGDHEEAIRLLEQAIQIDDRYAQSHYERGRILFDQGRYDEASAALLRARDEDVCPLRAVADVTTVVRQVAAEWNVPVVDFAAHVESRAAHGIPGEELFLDHVHPTIELHRELALLLLDQMRDDGIMHPVASWDADAIAAVAEEVSRRIDPEKHAIALRNLAKVLGWAGKGAEADRLALRAVESLPDDAEAQYQAGNACFRVGEFDEAITYYQQSLRLDPNSSQANYGLGLAYGALGDVARAEEHYRRSIQMDPAFVDAHYNLARIYEQNGRLELAARHYQTVTQQNPRDFEAYNSLGVVFAKMGRLADARPQFEEALRRNPDFADALSNLGLVFMEQGDLEQAIQKLQETLQRQPGNAAVQNNLQEALRRMEEHEANSSESSHCR